MSTAAFANRSSALARLLTPREEGTGNEVKSVEWRVQQLRHDYSESASITVQEAVLTEVFRVLADQWRNATRFQSSMKQSTNHPAYRAIVQLGNDIVPILLRELQRQPEPWFVALRELTGADPVTPDQRGNVRAIASAWVNWGYRHGLVR